MMIIKAITEKIKEEISDANAYADLAMEWSGKEPEAADVFLELSKEEMGHAEKLHTIVTGLIRKYREEKGEPPPGMLAVYNYLHEQQIAEAMQVRVKQGMVKEKRETFPAGSGGFFDTKKRCQFFLTSFVRSHRDTENRDFSVRMCYS